MRPKVLKTAGRASFSHRPQDSPSNILRFTTDYEFTTKSPAWWGVIGHLWRQKVCSKCRESLHAPGTWCAAPPHSRGLCNGFATKSVFTWAVDVQMRASLGLAFSFRVDSPATNAYPNARPGGHCQSVPRTHEP